MLKMLTTAQAAKRLKITPRRVQALIGSGRLPASKFGHVWMIAPADLAKVRHRKPGRPSPR
jgi:excisionase family DNA binding protein